MYRINRNHDLRTLARLEAKAMLSMDADYRAKKGLTLDHHNRIVRKAKNLRKLLNQSRVWELCK